MTRLAEPGPDLARRNRQVIAERTGWPDGALQTCERLDAEHPGWFVYWMPANDIRGWERPAGYNGALVSERAWLQVEVFAETVDELEEQFADMDARIEAYEMERRAIRDAMRRGIR
jgi:hypothetical protein